MGDAGLGPGGDTGGGVVGGDWVVDVNDETSLVSGVLAGDRGHGAGGAGAGAGDGQLGTADVVLRSLELLSSVQCDVLTAHQVVTGREVSGKVDGEVGDAGAARGVLNMSCQSDPTGLSDF